MAESSHSAVSRRTGRRWVWIVSLMVGLVVLAIAERAVRWAVTTTSLPTGKAQWIWATDSDARQRPEVFYLVRDFEVDFRIDRARLLCLADEEYVAILNGIQIGGGRMSDEGIVDAYSVEKYLQQGQNRLVIEARNSRQSGALLVKLEVSGRAQSATLLSDGTWQVFRQQVRSLGRAGEEIEQGEEPIVWGPPPVGRWPLPTKVRQRPTNPELLLGGEPFRAERVLQGGAEAAWQKLAGDAGTGQRFGPWVTFDWGRSVTGFLVLEYPAGETPFGLVYLGEDPPDPVVDRPITVLAGLEGGWLWSDSLPRRFRYVAVLVRGNLSDAMVYLTDPERSAGLVRAEPGSDGLFGLDPANLRAPLENEFRRELHRLTGAADREDL